MYKSKTQFLQRVLFLVLFGFISFSVQAHRSSFDGSVNEYRRGEFFAAFKGLKILAESGDVVSQYYVGLMYENGQGTLKDDALAFQWFTKAAAQNYAKAQNNLGDMYFSGRGTTRDFEKARLWFRKAASQGLAAAQWNLGNTYYVAPPRDISKAIYWFEKAAAKGDDVNQFMLALVYRDQRKYPKSDVKAAYWMRRAANRGMADAQRYTGDFYNYGTGVPRDYAKAMYWYEKASSQGHDEAQFLLAEMYRNGKGVQKDLNKARQWYCRAGGSGHGNAIYELVRDNPDGIKCLHEIAEQGIVLAQAQLGRWYENPSGKEHDYESAATWYRKAAEQGDETAMAYLGDLYALGSGVPQDSVIAKMLYLLSGAGQSGSSHSSRIRHPLSEAQINEAKSLAATWKVGAPLPDKTDTGHLNK